MLFTTATEWAALALTFLGGWLLGLASHPGGRKWRDRYNAERDAHAASRRDAEMKLTAADMSKAGLVDGVVKEPLGGAHTDPDKMIQTLKKTILKTLDELEALPYDERISQRIDKFSRMGVVVEA